MSNLIAIEASTLERIEKIHSSTADMVKDLAKQLKEAREPKFLTIEQLAERWQVSTCTIKRWKKDVGYFQRGEKVILFKIEDIKEFENNGYYPPRRIQNNHI